MNTKDKIENLMNKGIELIPYLHNASSYKQFQNILKQVQIILKQNSALKTTEITTVWEIDNVTLGDLTWGDYDAD